LNLSDEGTDVWILSGLRLGTLWPCSRKVA